MKVILIDKQDDQIEHSKIQLDQFVALELPELEKVESKEKCEKKENLLNQIPHLSRKTNVRF